MQMLKVKNLLLCFIGLLFFLLPSMALTADAVDEKGQSSKNNKIDTDKAETSDKDVKQQDVKLEGSTKALIELLKNKGLLTNREAEGLLKRHEESRAARQQEQEVLIEKVEKDVKKDISRRMNQRFRAKIKNEMLQEMNERSASMGPEWAQKIRFGGDIRLRYQRDDFSNDNAAVKDLEEATVAFDNAPNINTENPALINTTEDRQRVRVRLRLNAEADINPNTTAGLRLTTGNERDPVSTNESLGDDFNKDSIVLDRVYLRYKPFPELTLIGGRMPNVFFHTSLVWDSDINLEGIAAQAEIPITDKYIVFANAGAFPLREFEFRSDDLWLHAYQGGMILRPWRKDLSFKFGLAYYDYKNLEAEQNSGESFNFQPDFSIDDRPRLERLTFGNTYFNINPDFIDNPANKEAPIFGYASDYDIINLTGSVTIDFWAPVSVIVTGDYVKNVGYEREEVADKVGIADYPEEVEGYLIGLFVGYQNLKELWDWNVSLNYKYLERDAVVANFTDSDFRLGGTNAQGWILSGSLGLGDDLWMSASYYTADEINLDNYNAGTNSMYVIGDQYSVDVLQLDVMSKF